MGDARRSWWRTFFGGHHRLKGVRCNDWWPTLHKDAQQHYQSCDACHRTKFCLHTPMAKLITMLPIEPFMKWGLDFIGSVKPMNCSHDNKYMLIVINYVAKWVEVKALRTNMAIVIVQFIYEFILTTFGCPFILVNNQCTHFINDAIEILTAHFLFWHTSFTTYNPHGNSQAKSTNKVIGLLLTKLVNEDRIDWDEHLHNVLFAYIYNSFQGGHKSYSFSVGVWIACSNTY
jgi:hypothetical protein